MLQWQLNKVFLPVIKITPDDDNFLELKSSEGEGGEHEL